MTYRVQVRQYDEPWRYIDEREFVHPRYAADHATKSYHYFQWRVVDEDGAVVRDTKDENGTCPVHDFELPCPSCDMAAGVSA